MTEPSGGSDLAGAEDHRGQRRRRLGHQRVQDVHHQRLLRRPGRGRRAHRRRRRRREGITLFGVETDARRLHPRPQARQGRPGRVRHRRAVLRGRPGPRRRHHRRARQRLHPHDDVPAAGAARLGDHQPRPRRADPRRDARSTPRTARRSASRSAPSSTTSSCSPSWSPGSRSPRPTSTSACSRTPSGELTADRRRQGEVVDRRRCRTTCSTTASSCTAATAT